LYRIPGPTIIFSPDKVSFGRTGTGTSSLEVQCKDIASWSPGVFTVKDNNGRMLEYAHRVLDEGAVTDSYAMSGTEITVTEESA
jgi:hypothetical protein